MNTKSFTLIELLVVVSILGLLSSLVLIGLQGAKDQADIGKAQEFSHTVRVSLGADLVGEWRLDDGAGNSAVDSSGYGNDGDWNGIGVDGTHWTTAGIYDGAALFNGSDDFIRITNSSHLDFSSLRTNYTLGLWIKTSCQNCGIYRVNGSGHDRHIYLNGGDICQRVWTSETICTIGTDYGDGEWHYVVQWLKKGVGQRIYVDGVEAASGIKDESDFDWAEHADIGFSDDAANDYFNGMIDEVQIFNQPLSLTEIQQQYSQGAVEHGIVLSH